MIKKEGMPKVSIITVVFNGEETIEKTIRSVVGQTFCDFEFLVIDGGSTDLTIERIDKYRDKIDYFISEKDNGIYDAMNKGLKMAKGEWVLFMNAGDTFCNAESIVEFFKYESDFRDASIVYGDVNLLGVQASTLLKQDTKDIRYESICHQGQFVKREILLAHSGYDITYKIYADFDFQLKVLLENESRLVYCSVSLANYNMQGVSSKMFYHFLPEYLAIIMKVPMPQRVGYYFYAYQFALKSFVYELTSRFLRRKNG